MSVIDRYPDPADAKDDYGWRFTDDVVLTHGEALLDETLRHPRRNVLHVNLWLVLASLGALVVAYRAYRRRHKTQQYSKIENEADIEA